VRGERGDLRGDRRGVDGDGDWPILSKATSKSRSRSGRDKRWSDLEGFMAGETSRSKDPPADSFCPRGVYAGRVVDTDEAEETVSVRFST
jgi:hypothetical protein